MGQHLVPVTSWASLRILLRVVVRGCQVCQGEHEGTLVEQAARRVPKFLGANRLGVDWTAAWVVSPTPSCVEAGGRLLGRTVKKPAEWVITPLAVDEGRVFVVVEGDEQADVTTRTREKETV